MKESTKIGLVLMLWGVAIFIIDLLLGLQMPNRVGTIISLFIFFILLGISGLIFFIGLVIVAIKSLQWVIKN